MRKLALAAVAFGALALAAPAAQAAPAYEGGCGFASGDDPSGQVANPDTFTGVIYAAVVGYDDSGTGNPATVTVTCNLYVNGSLADSATFSGTGVAAGAEDTSFLASDGSVVQLCDHVTVNGHDFGEICFDADEFEVPPQEFWDIVDPIICPIFQTLSPFSIPPFTEWDAEGDYTVLGVQIYDCPPYGV